MAIWFLPGFKFDPSDTQLLECYLKAKNFGKKLPSDCIKDKVIYGPNANPWEIFNDSSTQWITGKSMHEKVVYVFASLTKIAADKESSGVQGNEHNVRKAGCGIWHDETGRRPVMEGKNLIGHKRMLVFQINDINGLGDGVCLNNVGYWKMHEYFLHGFENYVVCRITFDRSKRAKVVKAVSGIRGSGTKSRASKKNATSISTTKDDRGEAVLIGSSYIFRGSGKEVATNYDSRIVDSNYTVEGGRDYNSGLSYKNQRCHAENLLATMNSLCCSGSDQGLILNKSLPQYDNGSNFKVDEQEFQGFVANDDHRLNYEAEAQPVKRTSGDFENQLGTVLSNFNSGPDDDDVYLDLDDLFDGGDFWSDMNNLLQDDVAMDFGNLCDSEKEIEKFLGQVDNNMEEKQHQQQQPMQNMSCMLGKRKGEDSSRPNKKSRI